MDELLNEQFRNDICSVHMASYGNWNNCYNWLGGRACVLAHE